MRPPCHRTPTTGHRTPPPHPTPAPASSGQLPGGQGRAGGGRRIAPHCLRTGATSWRRRARRLLPEGRACISIQRRLKSHDQTSCARNRATVLPLRHICCRVAWCRFCPHPNSHCPRSSHHAHGGQPLPCPPLHHATPSRALPPPAAPTTALPVLPSTPATHTPIIWRIYGVGLSRARAKRAQQHACTAAGQKGIAVV